MALTKGRAAATQLTASGTGDTLDVSDSYESTLYYSHLNGSGSISAQGSIVIEGRTSGGSTWYTIAEVGFGTTASARVENCLSLPPDLSEVRCVYTAPTGSTGHAFDCEAGTVTALS